MGCRVVRVDNTIVDWRNVLVEWRNASHYGHLIFHHVVKQGPCDRLSSRTSRTSGQHNCRLEKHAKHSMHILRSKRVPTKHAKHNVYSSF